MDKNNALQNLLNGIATEEDVAFLQHAIANGEISIGGDMSRSVVIIGSGNKVELTAEALEILKSETKIVGTASGDPPYMGLRYFDTSDANLFYGREALTRELLTRVQKEPFLVIVGASGSGKSSVARAGLIPAWKKVNERSAIHVITPTVHPLEELSASLTFNSESVTATTTLMDDLQKDSRSLRIYVKRMFVGKFLLLVDQFEETFTLCKDLDERKVFIENLLSLVKDNDDVHVVLTLRADFYHHCAEFEGLRLMLEKHQAYIGAMAETELLQAITMPAEKNGWGFQPGLVDLILQDVNMEPGALPLLSHALLETWKRRQGRMLTLQGYHGAGGVKKAIAHTAESVYDQLSVNEQSIVCDIFLRLTYLGNYERHDVGRLTEIKDLLPLERDSISISLLLDKLANARLIVKNLRGNKVEIKVAHEALIQYWERLRFWLDQNRENAKLYQSLSDAAREWDDANRDENMLIHRGGRLEEVEILSQQARYKPNSLEEDYLKACSSLREREVSDRRRLEELTEQLSFLKTNQLTSPAVEWAKSQSEVLLEAQKREIILENMRLKSQRRHELLIKAMDAVNHALSHTTYSRNTVETQNIINELLAAVKEEAMSSSPEVQQMLDELRNNINGETSSLKDNEIQRIVDNLLDVLNG